MRTPTTSAPRQLLCLAALAALLTAAELRADDWPQWLGPQRDGVWRETGLLDKFPAGGPKVLWRAPIHGGYAGPAVAGGRVYVTDRVLAPGARNSDDPFKTTPSAGKERVLCLDEATGKLLWEHSYDCTYAIAYPAGPRATPLISGGKVYTLGAMGDLLCLDAAGGRVLWSKNFSRDYKARTPLWGFAAHPLLDGDRLICLVGGTDHVAVAFDKDTGKEKWHALSLERPLTQIGYCPPMIYQVGGGPRQLIIWDPEGVNSLDPVTGKRYWSQEFFAKANLTIPTPRLAGDLLLVTSFYNGAMLLKLGGGAKPGAEVVWKSRARGETPGATDKLHSIMPTPFIEGGFVYGVCSYGELRCLRLEDGKRLWETRKPTSGGEPVRWANAFLVPNGDRYFLFNEKGDLIIARLTPKGYDEIDRAHVLSPTNRLSRDRVVLWSHPAFANKCLFARNDKEIVCVSLAAE
jgi:outer membrane protein assembly factor BamB